MSWEGWVRISISRAIQECLGIEYSDIGSLWSLVNWRKSQICFQDATVADLCKIPYRSILNKRQKYISLRRDEVIVSNGRKTIREVVGHPGAVAIVPITKDQKIILVRQYRYAAQKVLLEVPAGTLEIAEDPKLAAIRELREETGFSAKNLKYLTGFWTAPGFCSEFIHGYLATELIEDPLSPDEDEFIELMPTGLDDAMAMMQSGAVSYTHLPLPTSDLV